MSVTEPQTRWCSEKWSCLLWWLHASLCRSFPSLSWLVRKASTLTACYPRQCQSSRQGETHSRGRPVPDPVCGCGCGCGCGCFSQAVWAEAEKHLGSPGNLPVPAVGSHTGLRIALVCSLASVQKNTDQVNWERATSTVP